MRVRNFALYTWLQHSYLKNNVHDVLLGAATEAQQGLID